MAVTNWLLEGEPWVVYRTRMDLMGESFDSPGVKSASIDLVQHAKIQALLEELLDWPGQVLKSHKKAGLLLHKLVFIADIGIQPDYSQVSLILDKVRAMASDEGPYQILVNLPKAFGGSGMDESSWMLCDAGSTLFAMAKLAGTDDPSVRRAAEYLAGLVREEGGWPCAATSRLGKFHGPGRIENPCPYANLLMVKALLPFGDEFETEIHLGAQVLLDLWGKRREEKPYLFAMGSGFEKLKAPLVWYDILHVLEVLSQVTEVRNEPAVLEMADIVRAKADAEGRYQPESIWMDWRGWDFGQKREPSRWLTFLVTRMLKRLTLR